MLLEGWKKSDIMTMIEKLWLSGVTKKIFDALLRKWGIADAVSQILESDDKAVDSRRALWERRKEFDTVKENYMSLFLDALEKVKGLWDEDVRAKDENLQWILKQVTVEMGSKAKIYKKVLYWEIEMQSPRMPIRFDETWLFARKIPLKEEFEKLFSPFEWLERTHPHLAIVFLKEILWLSMWIYRTASFSPEWIPLVFEVTCGYIWLRELTRQEVVNANRWELVYPILEMSIVNK